MRPINWLIIVVVVVVVERCAMVITTVFKERMKSDAANQPATASVAIQLLQDLLLRPLQFRDAFSSLGFAMVTTTAATADQTNSTAVNVTTSSRHRHPLICAVLPQFFEEEERK